MRKLILLGMLFLTTVLLDGQTPGFQWANSIGSTGGGDDVGKCIKTDVSGNTFVCGSFIGTVDFDPSPAIFNLSSYYGSQDFFIAKYGPTGNLIWAKGFGGLGIEDCPALAVDAAGNVYVAGSFVYTVDFDPSTNVSNLVQQYGTNLFLAKYDPSGNFVWAKGIIGNTTLNAFAEGLNVDMNGDILLTGSFSGTLDFDPSASTVNLISTGNLEIFIAKYTSAGNYVWAHRFGSTFADYAHSVSSDGAGNVYIAGQFKGTVDFDPSASTNTLVTGSSSDIFIAKYDLNGNYVWAKNMSSSSAGEDIYCIFSDASGNLYIAGDYGGTTDFDPSAGVYNLSIVGGVDAFFAKYNSSGNLIFARSIGGMNFDAAYSIVADALGSIYVTGGFRLTCDFDPSSSTANLITATNDGNDVDIFLAKYDVNGNYVWAKNMLGNSVSNDIGRAITLDGNSGVLITGQLYNTSDFDPSSAVNNLVASSGSSFFVGKYDLSSCNLLYGFSAQETVGGTDNGKRIKKDAAGNVYTMGNFIGTVDFDPSAVTATLSSPVTDGIFITKYDPSGNYIWAKCIVVEQINFGSVCSAADLYIDPTGNVYLTGSYNGTIDFDPSVATSTLTSYLGVNDQDAFFAKYDNSGNYLWAKSIGGVGSLVGAESGCVINSDAAGNVLVAGYFQTTTDFDPSPATATLSTSGFSEFAMFIAKYDLNGNYVWSKGIIGSANKIPKAITIDNSNIYLTGYFTGVADFDPAAPAYMLTASGSEDAFISKYDMNGNLVWANKIGGSSQDVGNSIVLDASGNIYTTGYFYGTVDFDPSASISNLVSAGTSDGYIAKYDNLGNYVWAKRFGGTNLEIVESIDLDMNNKIIISGYFYGTSDFDPSTNISNLVSVGNADCFLAAYDNSGSYSWAFSFGNVGSDRAYSVLTHNGSIYTTGYYGGTIDCDPSASVNNLISSGTTQDVFIAKYGSSTTTGHGKISIVTSMLLTFPNPNAGNFTIQCEEEDHAVILNQIGQVIQEVDLNVENNYKVQINNLRSGIYLIKGKNRSAKVIVN
ncbi:MAG: hypothetical protein KBG47_08670 [Bacteroidia bacterium]|nr:hypothetical protein [Sphingobacteriaceae bacterium]MBP9069568.1 hypothetical protein [Bacteroidia bacterium]